MHIIIIGAGIVGASCAYYLTQRGANVTILEKASHAATGSTAKSAAGIRHQFSHPENVKMSHYSALEFLSFAGLTGEDAGFRRVGYLFLLPEALWAESLAQRDMQVRLGADVVVLSPDELAARFGFIATDGLAGATLGLNDGVLDPHAITLGYLRAARAAGARVVFDTEVTSLRLQRDVWQLMTSSGAFSADVVVNAAGPFAGELAGLAGFDLPVLPYRRNVYVSAPVPDFAHPTPLMIDMTSGVYVRSEGQRFMIGLSNPDEPSSHSQAVDWEWLERTLDLALPRFPFLETVGLDQRSCWAGSYAITPDHLPILGRLQACESFVQACGFSGHGVQHAPATGLIIAEEIMDGQAHSFDITDFRYERFEKQRFSAERNIV